MYSLNNFLRTIRNNCTINRETMVKEFDIEILRFNMQMKHLVLNVILFL